MLDLPLVCCKFQSRMKRGQGTIDLTLTKVKEKKKFAMSEICWIILFQ